MNRPLPLTRVPTYPSPRRDRGMDPGKDVPSFTAFLPPGTFGFFSHPCIEQLLTTHSSLVWMAVCPFAASSSYLHIIHHPNKCSGALQRGVGRHHAGGRVQIPLGCESRGEMTCTCPFLHPRLSSPILTQSNPLTHTHKNTQRTSRPPRQSV